MGTERAAERAVLPVAWEQARKDGAVLACYNSVVTSTPPRRAQGRNPFLRSSEDGLQAAHLAHEAHQVIAAGVLCLLELSLLRCARRQGLFLRCALAPCA